MTTPEPPSCTGDGPGNAPWAATAADAERRLHPMSWLFVLLAQLKQFVVPLVALLVFGRGDRNELWPLIGVGVLVLVSLWRYFTYRYGVVGENLVVRSGLLERSLRVIPFARIHNVALEQSVLHRLFGVAEVRLESAGGKKPEAEMRVLTLADALALEGLVRHRGAAAATRTRAGSDADPTSTADGTAHAKASAADTAPTTLLALPLGEVLRHGLVSNRGMIVLAAGFATLSQFGNPSSSADAPRMIGRLAWQWGERAFGYTNGHDPLQYAAFGLSLLVALVALLRLFSIALALLQFHGFRLSEHGRRLTVERGLLARWRTSASTRRIQAWTLREGVVHRLLNRRSLDVDTAVTENGEQQRTLRELVPIAPPATCDCLIQHLLPHGGWPALNWTPLPVGHWWRLALPHVPFIALASALLYWRLGVWGLLALLWLPWAAYASWQRARRAAFAVNSDLVAVRTGWWTRTWRFAEIDKLQVLQLTQSPIDRRCGTATLSMDTAGASPLAPPLQLRFLPRDTAQSLHAALARDLARRKLQW